MIDYKWVTEDTKEAFEAVLQKHGTAFVEWRANGRTDKPLDLVFAKWWTLRGPVGFRTSADVLRFKKELFSYVTEKLLV